MSVRIATAATLAALSFAAPAFADSTGNGGDNDIYRTSKTFKTFSDGYTKTGRFERIDVNKDGVISRDEQLRYEFARFDSDNDGELNDAENAEWGKEYDEEIAGGNPDGQ